MSGEERMCRAAHSPAAPAPITATRSFADAILKEQLQERKTGRGVQRQGNGKLEPLWVPLVQHNQKCFLVASLGHLTTGHIATVKSNGAQMPAGGGNQHNYSSDQSAWRPCTVFDRD